MKENPSRFPALPLRVMLCLLAFLGAAAAVGPAMPENEQTVGQEPPCSHEFAVEAHEGVILLPVEIGGSPSLDFIVDSGANATTVNDFFLAEALNLRYLAVGRARGIGVDPIQVLIAPDVAVYSGGVELLRTDVAIHHVSPVLMEHSGRDLHGLLGAELFERYVVEIDPVNDRLLLHEAESYRYQGSGIVLRLQIEGRRPFLKADVVTDRGKRLTATLLLDTGSAGTVALIKDSHRHLRLPEEHIEIDVVGVGGAASAFVGRIQRLDFGAFSLQNPAATFIHRYSVPAMRGVRKLHGLVGNGLLRRFHSIIDYQRRRLILEKNPRYDEPFESGVLGVRVVADWPDLLNFRVDRVEPGSPADAAGVEIGDVILAVDGRPIDQFEPEGSLKSNGATAVRCILTIRRGATVRNLELRVSRR